MSIMASSVQTVHSDGIYHGLPDISADRSGLRAIVVGASGMSGQSMVDVLARRWQKVYALSRRAPQPRGGPPHVMKHVPLDLLNEPSDIAKSLADHHVKA